MSLGSKSNALDDSAEESEDQVVDLSEKVMEEETVYLPTIAEGPEAEQFCKATAEDPSLGPWRTLADTCIKGFHWKRGRLFQKVVDYLFQHTDLPCIPTQYRSVS